MSKIATAENYGKSLQGTIIQEEWPFLLEFEEEALKEWQFKVSVLRTGTSLPSINSRPSTGHSPGCHNQF